MQTVHAEGTAPDGAIKLIMCTIAFRDRLLDHALEAARETGFDGVEIWGREPHIAEKFDETRVRAARKLLESKGVTPYALGSYLRFAPTKPDGAVPLADVMHTARWLKTPLVRVWASDVGSAEAKPAVWDAAVAEAREACEAADRLRITLAVEMHTNTLTDTAAAATEFVQRVDCENLKLNFQIASYKDGQTPEERLEAVLPWVAHVHAQNYSRLPNSPNEPVHRTSLAAGVANYRRLVGILKEANYRGCIAVEFAYDESDGRQKAIAADLKYLRSLCEQEA